ncbi:hypothetical protein CORC01_04596 [Colletotrichum orchidophilum]|uniref:Uncharacterized protein n=1 Tax=Colletotrichum orchidophilum TaxID=1209926 RepID=A0A1G4BFR0_9PEZI|nr:uncharacterized protein CORC01_04596 [Colletotrichum orchidophilum]OHF00188.1 hypothetical protein CORC01_04596 [Colletotrichum orchidophilum]
MALSLLISFGTAVGASEGIKASMAKSRREEHRSRKNNLIVHCPKSSEFSPYLEGRQVVLSGDRLFIDTGTAHNIPFGHPFEGYYLPYPDSRFSGLVSTITHEAPIMNWIFVDPVTFQFRFGNRAMADGNVTGPWDCTRQDRRLTFCGWEGFCAVLEDSGIWGLYFDCNGDGLRQKLGDEGRVVIEIELIRREMRTTRPDYIDLEKEKKDQAESITPQPARAEEGSTCGPDRPGTEVKKEEVFRESQSGKDNAKALPAYDWISHGMGNNV